MDRFRLVWKVGHDEARVVLGIAAGMPHDLGLDHHARRFRFHFFVA
jgi:hypothetical protein